jgi:signal transduction histidine kinase
MEIKAIILVSVAFLNFALGATILFQNYKSLINRRFAFFAFSLGLWSLLMMFYENVPYQESQVYFWSLLLHFAGALIAHSFFYFTLVYPDGKNLLKQKLKFFYHILSIPIVLIFYFLFINRDIITGINHQDEIRNLIYGDWYIFYFLFFFSYIILGLLILFYKSTKAKGIDKKRIQLLLWSMLPPFVYAGALNMVFVNLLDFHYAWTGPIALLVVVVAIAYGIIKLNLLNVKVITTEIFAVFLTLVSLIEIFLYDSTSELIFRIIIFLITLGFAILLIRSVLREVHRREQMEKLTKELKKAGRDLKKANKELKRLDNAKSEFLSIASHQLRTPLTVIKGYVSMMQEGSFGKVPKLIGQNLDKVYISTERLISLVESLLNISRIESGRLEFDVKPVDLTSVVSSIVEGFQKKARDKKLKLEFLPDENLPKAAIDEQKIKEVISNIIDNSVKYTEKGSITVGLHQESQSIVFSCQDTGIGVLPEDLPRLFEKFVRGKGMMQVYTEGTGLGMYFARMVVENMGGRIWAESPGKNKGSKFSFSVPMADKGKAKKVKTA